MNDQSSNPIIRLDHVSRRYGNTFAMNDVSIEVPRGGVLGLVGANGAGKTTLIKHILGLLKPQTGKVEVFGMDPVKRAVTVLSRLGYLSEDRDLPPWITVGELLRYSRTFYPTWDPTYAQALREQFQLSPSATVRTLSKGELAKLGLLVALAHRPELLILDEPSSGLDPIVRRAILEAIVRSVGDEGRTVLFSSHLLDEIARVSDRVAMMAQGKLVLSGDLHVVVESHRRFVVKMPGDILKRLPGALSIGGGPNEWTVICNGAADAFLHAVRENQGEVVEQMDATFEEIFHAKVGGAQTVDQATA
jgi:ABC-2 type transport system ATP-binding protein